MSLNPEQQKIYDRAELLTQTGNQFLNWMRDYPEVVDARKDVLNKEFWRHTRQAKLIGRAATRPVNIGVFGASQAGKSYLISALTRHPDNNRCTCLFNNIEYDFLKDMNPPGGGESTGIVSRFTLNTPPNVNARYPVRIQLLRRVEILKILINAYLSDLNLELDLQLNETDLEQFLADYDESGDGASCADFYELEEYFDTYFSNTVTAKILKPYWKRLGAIAAALTGERYMKFCGLFWNFNAALSRLWQRLCTALEKIGHPEYLSAGTEVLDKNHNGNRNILYASVLEELIDGSGYSIPVRLDDGRETQIDLGELAGLVIEITIVLPKAPDDIFHHTDLLDFPGARSRLELSTRVAGSNEAFSQAQLNNLIENKLYELFKRGKVDYLYQKYVDENEFTAMLLCMGDGPQEVKTILSMIERWLRYTHGSNPDERRNSDTALFMVLTKMDLHLEKAELSAINEIWSNRIHSSLIEPYGKKDDNDSGVGKNADNIDDWLNEWIPSRPFNNSFWLRNPDIAQASFVREQGRESAIHPDWQERMDKLKQSFSNNPYAQRHFANPEEAFGAALIPNDGGVSYILKHLAKISRPQLKTGQLQMQADKLTQKMQRQMHEFYKDGDCEKELKKRNEANRPVISALRYCRKMQRIGQLLQCLMIRESSVLTTIKALHHSHNDVANEHIADVDLPVDDDDYVDDVLGEGFAESNISDNYKQPEVVNVQYRLAEQILNDWSTAIYDLVNDAKVQQFFQLDAAAFDVFLNEIFSGSRASGLQQKLATISQKISRIPQKEHEIMAHHARCIANAVNDYINFLDLYDCGHTISSADKQTTQALFERPSLALGEIPQLKEANEHKQIHYHLHWMRAYVLRIEENVRFETNSLDLNTQANGALGVILDRLT